jgi:hypothetical protein
MGNKNFRRDIWIIVLVFAASRVIIGFFGIHLQYRNLFQYWQYLDVETLKHDLLKGVWYDHAQPPLFNIMVGAVLKLSGTSAPAVFASIFKLVSLANTLLIYRILKRLTSHGYIPIIISLIYLLSPATLIFECELFYTTLVSMLLLISCWFLIDIREKPGWRSTIGFFVALTVLCLTRSLYHLFWLVLIAVLVLYWFRKEKVFSKLLICSVIAILVTGGWYVKNYFLFGKFSTSTWIGMNFSRNVFHDNEVLDSSRIEAYAPFSKISVYRSFISQTAEKKYDGLDNRDLLNEFKNDSFINANQIGYIEVSDRYMIACKQYIRANPVAYLKNVVQSCLIFFAPATRYSLTEKQAQKIKAYDIVYSFNLSHFAEGKEQRRVALLVSSIPKILVYLFVFFVFFQQTKRNKFISPWNLFLIATIGFVFGVSSLLEHYENMRFRYEVEPLFLILAGQVASILLNRKNRIQHPEG